MKRFFTEEQGRYFMELALAEARMGAKEDEVPIGAVIVDKNGSILSRAHNMVEARDTQTAHAELLALAQAGKKMGDWRLLDCWLYVTLEPCAMCMQAIKLHRLAGVVYGADSPLFGHQLDKNAIDSVYNDDTVQIISGIGQPEAGELLKQFFKKKRNEDGKRSKKVGPNKGAT